MRSRPIPVEDHDFKIGDRVRMNSLGLDRHPRYARREGEIVGLRQRNSPRIKWDNCVSVQAIYRKYLERVIGQPTTLAEPAVGRQFLETKGVITARY